MDAQFPGGVLVVRTYREAWKLKKGKRTGKPSKEVVYHVSSLAPEQFGGGDVCAERLAGIVRTHWYVEVYHGKRDNGYHEDALTHRCDTNVMAAMMVARTLGMWVCARSPEKTTGEVRLDLLRHPSKLLRIMMKGGLQ